MVKSKRTITPEQLLQLRGLLVLRDQVNKEHNSIEKAMATLLNEPTTDGLDDYYGLVSDYMWDEGGAEGLLDSLDIKVVKKK